MRWICRYQLRGLIGLTTLAATLLISACGGEISDAAKEEEQRQDFLSRILPSGDSPSAWNYIWGCEVLTRSGSYHTLVPLRFYRDAQFQAGIGTSEVLGTWKRDEAVEQPGNLVSLVLTLDESGVQFFGTDNKQLLVDVWRNADNYMDGSSGFRLESEVPENTVQIDLTCVRYDEAGNVVNDDLPGWLRRFEETPSFITTGEASIQVTPIPPSQIDEESDTPPTSDEPASEPVNSPLADPTPTTTEPSTTAPLADVNAQVKDIWYTGDFVDTVDGVRQIFGTVIEFNNGEVSRDGETISNEGIASSKSKNPEDWGLGRVSSSGLLSYKWSTSRSWLEPFLSAPTRSYPRNQKIRGCFENSTGVKGLGSSPLITRLCLSENGSFRLDDAGNNTGNYLIEDHAIRLDFSSGESAEFLFGGYYNDGFIYRLIIADRVFYVTD